jgi:integrase
MATPLPRTSQRVENIQFFTPDELRRLLSAAQKRSVRDYAIILIAYRHGLRASEIGLLQVSDLDFQRLQLRVHRVKPFRTIRTPKKGSNLANRAISPVRGAVQQQVREAASPRRLPCGGT